ncbi:LysM peptidoglycan-binding domain-containing protein [bacterium AH-315-J04]|nr:LysM peptidoglycan-binding domain-containing protein [bacterium AH-315-J04]
MGGSVNGYAGHGQSGTVNRNPANQSQHNRSVDGLIRYAAGAIVPVVQPSANHSRMGGEYEVKSGDTLYKIAARQMGKSSRRNVNAIFDANRATMSSPDELKVGMKIVIPSMPAQQTSRRSANAPQSMVAASNNNHRPVPARLTPRFRWYQIKQNDRYINIARNELGDAKRWQEIHDLNKRNFPDPDKIRAGVRIKLPLASAIASSRLGR